MSMEAINIRIQHEINRNLCVSIGIVYLFM